MKQNQQKTSRTINARCLGVISTLGASIAIAGLQGGCMSYTNVPEPTSAPAFESANHFQSIKVTRTALEEVTFRYPMRDDQGHYSVNLPAGTTLESAQSIVRGLPEGVVIPFDGMDESIPVYHIGRIWIRASDAKVDVLYPARAFDGSAFMGTVTVWMNGGVQPWRVSRVQHWAPGTIPTPPMYVPLPKETLEANESAAMDEAPDEEPGEELGDETPDQPEASLQETQPEPDSETETETEPVAEQTDPDAPYRQVPIDD